MTDAAAVVQDSHLDVVVANALGRALFAPMFERLRWRERHGQLRAARLPRDPGARVFYNTGPAAAEQTVAVLCTEGARRAIAS